MAGGSEIAKGDSQYSSLLRTHFIDIRGVRSLLLWKWSHSGTVGCRRVLVHSKVCVRAKVFVGWIEMVDTVRNGVTAGRTRSGTLGSSGVRMSQC